MIFITLNLAYGSFSAAMIKFENRRDEYINNFLGTDISKEDMAAYLKAIEFDVDMKNMTISVPTFRPDIELQADVAEEVARFYGYDVIPTTLLSGEATAGRKTKKQLRIKCHSKLLLS